jgi:CheY-like chemotaxis protein
VAARDASDLVVLDLMLPDLPGEEVARALRTVSRVPIIMLTAKAEEADRVAGLRLGADDYVVKPLSSARSSTTASQPRQGSRNQWGAHYGSVTGAAGMAGASRPAIPPAPRAARSPGGPVPRGPWSWSGGVNGSEAASAAAGTLAGDPPGAAPTPARLSTTTPRRVMAVMWDYDWGWRVGW